MRRSPTAQATLDRLARVGVRLGLDTSRRLLAALGDPQTRFPVILVAGTNGKGSTAALMAAIAAAAGYRTGLYTSPHLEEVEERVRIDGLAISSGRLAELLDEVVGAAAAALEDPPTYFEALTALAFSHFSHEGVDLAVVEIGLGGRLDATNVCEPILSLVTEISLEHQQYLGSTLAEIAREKAGILRAGRPALAWVEDAEALRALEQAAGGGDVPLRSVASEVRWSVLRTDGWRGQEISLETPLASYCFRLPLLGRHQVKNAALATRAGEVLATLGFDRIDAARIAAGIAVCRWPGRLEAVAVGTGKTVLLDAAHNPAAVEVVCGFLDQRGSRFDLLFGVLEDKEFTAMLPPLAQRAARVTLTVPEEPRGLNPRALVPLVANADVEPEIDRALDRALSGDSPLLVVCGSIYLVGAVRRLLTRRFGLPEPAVSIPTGG